MYLFCTKSNSNTIELRVTDFDVPTVSCNDISEFCDNWELLGKIVDRLFSGAINGDSNVVH